MILSDREIAAAIEHQQIVIDPRPAQERWSSTAIDLTLDGTILRWKRDRPADGTGAPSGPHKIYPGDDGFSVRRMIESENLAEKLTIPGGGHVLSSRDFILAYTAERIYLPNHSRIAARVEGKSSLARLGIGVHVTAPTIHAGFGLNPKKTDEPGRAIQLEMFNLVPFEIYLTAGMPICQLILEEVRETPNKGYGGQFSDQSQFQA